MKYDLVYVYKILKVLGMLAMLSPFIIDAINPKWAYLTGWIFIFLALLLLEWVVDYDN